MPAKFVACVRYLLLCGVILSNGLPIDAVHANNPRFLHLFTGYPNDGERPNGPLLRDRAGNLYGTTYEGGGTACNNSGCGIVFRIAPDGTETVLHSFAGGDDGAWPTAGLIED